MAAIIGLEYSDLENILKNHNFLGVDFANFNTKTQIVLSGLREDIDRLEKFFEHEESVNFIKLIFISLFKFLLKRLLKSIKYPLQID